MSRQKVNAKNMPIFKKALERRSAKAIPRLLGMKDIVPSEFRYFSAVSNKAAAIVLMPSRLRLLRALIYIKNRPGTITKNCIHSTAKKEKMALCVQNLPKEF